MRQPSQREIKQLFKDTELVIGREISLTISTTVHAIPLHAKMDFQDKHWTADVKTE